MRNDVPPPFASTLGIKVISYAPDRIEALAFERGLLILGAGRNSIRLCPPLVISADQADFALDTLEECIALAS